MRGKTARLFAFLLCALLLFSACDAPRDAYVPLSNGIFEAENNNVPTFAEAEITTEAFESYSELDALGRCGAAVACLGVELMPTEERGAIGQIKPTGWQMAKYDIVDGKYLYNRCHLIGYQLSGENANEKNLITGTRHMNTEGMLPFENMVAEYIKETKNHVMYRVTPVFEGNELLARGVRMEAYSVEDEGEGISFNVFVYNTQPGIEISYADGKSRIMGGEADAEAETGTYVLNTNTKKFHLPTCPSAKDMKEKNKEEYTGSRAALLMRQYAPCGACNP